MRIKTNKINKTSEKRFKEVKIKETVKIKIIKTDNITIHVLFIKLSVS